MYCGLYADFVIYEPRHRTAQSPVTSSFWVARGRGCSRELRSRLTRSFGNLPSAACLNQALRGGLSSEDISPSLLVAQHFTRDIGEGQCGYFPLQRPKKKRSCLVVRGFFSFCVASHSQLVTKSVLCRGRCSAGCMLIKVRCCIGDRPPPGMLQGACGEPGGGSSNQPSDTLAWAVNGDVHEEYATPQNTRVRKAGPERLASLHGGLACKACGSAVLMYPGRVRDPRLAPDVA